MKIQESLGESNRLIFNIRIDKKTQTIITWDLDSNTEVGSLDVSLEAKVLNCLDGREFTIDGETVIDMDDSSFYYSFNVADMQIDRPNMFFNEGFKINSKCDAILVRNGIALPFSFYTFIVREQNALGELTEENFLSNAYLYKIRGNNCFHDYAKSYNEFQICVEGLK